MTVLTPPGYLQGGTYTALLDRMYAITAMSQRNPSLGHGARQGFYPDRYPTYSNPSAMNWVIGPGAGVIANTFTTDGGDYRFCNPTNATGSFAASSPTLNRYDILGFQVKDNFYDASGLNQVVPAVIQGANSAGTPVDPALPSSFIPVLRAVINAASTSPILQDLRPRTVNSMAILPVANNTERATLGNQPAGFTIWNIASGRHEVANGAGAWTPIDLTLASLGTQGGIVRTAGTTDVGTSELLVNSRTLDVVNGRSYILNFPTNLLAAGGSTPGGVTIRFRWAAGGTVTTSGNFIQAINDFISTGSFQHYRKYETSIDWGASSGQVTFGVFALCIAPLTLLRFVNAASEQREFRVTDDGPTNG